MAGLAAVVPLQRFRAPVVACLLLFLWSGANGMSSAQAYPELHVTALAQRTDRASVAPGGVFHLTIHVRIAQRRDRLDDLILGTFENCEIISNETERTAVTGGTDFVERLTVQALAPGVATISPAYIDAVDPALGRPMRYSSNAVRVEVTGGDPLSGALRSLGDNVHAAERVALRLLLAAGIVACVFAAGFVVFTLFARRKRRPPRVTAPATSAPMSAGGVPPAPPRDRLADAAEAYRSQRSQTSIVRVRGVLLELAGASPGATLVDALRALGDGDRDLRAALVCAEAAAFGPQAERAASGDAMLAAIDAYRGHRPADANAWTR